MQGGRDQACLGVVSGAGFDNRAVLHNSALEADRGGSGLAVKAKIQQTAGDGNGAVCGQAVIAAVQLQGAGADGCAAGISIGSGKGRSPEVDFTRPTVPWRFAVTVPARRS